MDKSKSAKVLEMVYVVTFGVGFTLARIHSASDVLPVLSSSAITVAVMAIAAQCAQESKMATPVTLGANVEDAALNGLGGGAIISIAVCFIGQLLG